jgi:hypothetical protein
MPTLEVDGFRLTINSRDERGHKAHVHVIKAGAKVLITLDASLAPYNLKDMSRRDVIRARELVAEHFGKLIGVVGEVQWLRRSRSASPFRL